MSALAVALHVLGAVVWVGGMFLIYVCLRPAAGSLEPAQRLQLLRGTFAKFFPWVWLAILTILGSGYWMAFVTLGGLQNAGLHVHLMQGIGWVMILLFAYLFHGPWLKFRRAADSADWQAAGGHLARIRRIVAINLPLGILVVIIGASGRYWG